MIRYLIGSTLLVFSATAVAKMLVVSEAPHAGIARSECVSEDSKKQFKEKFDLNKYEDAQAKGLVCSDFRLRMMKPMENATIPYSEDELKPETFKFFADHSGNDPDLFVAKVNSI